jgi:DNA-binding PadR family transcriptional regulator
MRDRKSGLQLSQQEFFILASLINGPKHGWAIKERVSEITTNKVKLSAATLYENLSKMVDSGLIKRGGDIEVDGGESRKVYQLTGAGESAFKEQCRIYNEVAQLTTQPGYGGI